MAEPTTDPQRIKSLLAPYRAEIDAVDDAIVELLAQRVGIVHRVAALKAQHGIPAVLPDRIEEVVARNVERGAAKGIDGEMLAAIYRVIIANACGLEDRIMYDGRAKS